MDADAADEAADAEEAAAAAAVRDSASSEAAAAAAPHSDGDGDDDGDGGGGGDEDREAHEDHEDAALSETEAEARRRAARRRERSAVCSIVKAIAQESAVESARSGRGFRQSPGENSACRQNFSAAQCSSWLRCAMKSCKSCKPACGFQCKH